MKPWLQRVKATESDYIATAEASPATADGNPV
jgi:hypothetical protein